MSLHTDFLYKYTYDGVRIYIVLLKNTVLHSAQVHGLSGADILMLGHAHTVAGCLAAMRKEDNASVCVSLRDSGRGRKYTAIAEPDGRLRGRADDIDIGGAGQNIVLEVTQKLSVRGDYTSVVSGTDIGAAVEEYFHISQQTVARCGVYATDDTYLCALVEQFPITQPEHEIYRGCAEREWNCLRSLFEGAQLTDLVMPERYERTSMFPIKFGCTCTRRSVLHALQSVSPQGKEESLQVQCKYCGKEYNIKI